jgi:transcriptional regulator of stress and heat shock response
MKVKESQNQKVAMMARLSDVIESFLKKLIEDTDGDAEIQRNELAIQFKCVPSQINYVIDTRFTNERGYFVESRRGGGGHIRIKRVSAESPSIYMMHIIGSIGDSISQQSAEIFINNFVDYDIITQREGFILKAATGNKVLGYVPVEQRDAQRAVLLKSMLMSLSVGK